jgi:hypothetical protein
MASYVHSCITGATFWGGTAGWWGAKRLEFGRAASIQGVA